ncbi:uncharacterized protein G2W53_031699 [Senna tora]|uniref:Uncharacterized protein n=1 Tax=Senna tora TaxID=362788 RepID=A0A834W713_9FABA|nr:uncharacterized protein G2W53_031699 [Senna tora]
MGRANDPIPVVFLKYRYGNGTNTVI